MRELVWRVHRGLTTPWNKGTGRPRSVGLYRGVEITCVYLRHNLTQEVLGDLRGLSQSTISRILTELVPVVTSVLSEFVPSVAEASELVEGRVCLVDGTVTPCWSYAEHAELWSRKRGTSGFNVGCVSLLDGTPIYVTDPLPGKTHDASAYQRTPIARIVASSGGAIADTGYLGHIQATPRRTPPRGELSANDKKANAGISALRAPVERAIAHLKTWRVLHTDYRRPYSTYRDAYNAARALFFFSLTRGSE